jgi:hypothetical protein
MKMLQKQKTGKMTFERRNFIALSGDKPIIFKCFCPGASALKCSLMAKAK